MVRNCFGMLLLLCVALCGCRKAKQSSWEKASDLWSDGSSFDEMEFISDSIRYAMGFSVADRDGFVEVEVRDPWNEGRVLQRYLLVPRNGPLPEGGLPDGTVVRVPLRNMVVYTSVHSAAIDALGAADYIVGVCEPRYIKVDAVKKRLDEGLTKDLGAATSPNIERMIEAGAEVVIASPFDHGGYGAVEKLGIPIIECADYMETSPLGRAEWIKFLGLFTQECRRADSLFSETEANYLGTQALVRNVTARPRLMTGKKYGSPWYVPSGDSFMAQIYRDAGADYVFDYLPGTGSVPLSFETVFSKAVDADIWLINYNKEGNMTYDDLKSDYSPYSGFSSFRNRRVFGNNTNYSLFYEEIPMNPDYLLTELIAIFHPELLPSYKLRYFHGL